MFDNNPNNYVRIFGQNLHQAFEINKTIKRLQEKLLTLENQLGNLKNSIQNTQDFENNLPQEFINVLNELKQYIIDIEQVKKYDKVSKAKAIAVAPLHNLILNLYQKYKQNKNNLFELSSIPNFNYYLAYIKNNNFQENITLPETQSELLQQIISANINQRKLKNPNLNENQIESLSNYITQQYSFLVNNANASVKSAQNINAITIGTTIFNEIKAQFLDKLSEYCTKIISAEDVHLGNDGSINGIVHAENGSFYVRTIYAGGYNIQKLHFRVIITPLKTK